MHKHSGACPPIDASKCSWEEMVQILIEHNADLDAEDHYGNTALHKAATSGQTGCVGLLLVLLEAGADTTIEIIEIMTASQAALHKTTSPAYKKIAAILDEQDPQKRREMLREEQMTSPSVKGKLF